MPFAFIPKHVAGRLPWLAAAAGAIALLMLPPTVQAQYNGPDRVSCTSDGGRVYCDADTSGGVRLSRQYQDSGACIEGRTWGYDSRGVWVDRGCAGEFALLRPQSYNAQPAPYTRIEPGTTVAVRTNVPIDTNHLDYRVYTANVDQDVFGSNGQIAIPRGSQAELIVRRAPDNDLILDLESVTIAGQRYALRSEAERIESQKRGQGLGENRSTAEHVGGGAALGAIIGAIAGGGKGAAVGAAVGGAAGAGTQVLTRGSRVFVPAESLLTFRIDQPLEMGVPDRGVDRDGYHYHDYYDRPRG